jgi:hypothetical protein
MVVNKTEVIENLKVKCTFDVGHGASAMRYYVESLLDGSILHIGHGNANEEMNEKDMNEYVLRVGLDLIKLSRYKDHVESCKNKLEKAFKIIGDISSSDSNFKQACLFLEEIKNE